MMTVRSFPEPDASSQTYRRFCLAGPETGGSLEHKHLLLTLGRVLQDMGYVHDHLQPDFEAALAFRQEKEIHIEDLYTTHRYHPGYVYRPPAPFPPAGGWYPYTAGGGTRKVNARWLKVTVVSRKGADSGRVIWEGDVASDGKRDLFTVAPCLFKGLLEEFPDHTGVTTKRFEPSCLERSPGE
jgi:hypothetical protein